MIWVAIFKKSVKSLIAKVNTVSWPPLTYFLSLELPILDIFYTWNHTLYGLLCLASLTAHHIFKVHSRCSVSVLYSLLGLISIVFYVYATLCLFLLP